MTKAMLIAAPMSGSGKTSVCRGLAAALALGKAGGPLRVQTFKMGPDYLDPLHLSVAGKSPCHNLDPWMMGAPACKELFARHTACAAPRPDLALVEGAMGLFDGGDPASNAGSSADLAKILNIPVVLVVDIARQGRSVAALVKGFIDFDPELRITGLILNRAGSKNHGDLVRAALASTLPDLPVFGCLPARKGLELPSRHLGLRPPEKGLGGHPDAITTALAEWVAESLDFEALFAILPGLPGEEKMFGGAAKVKDTKKSGVEGHLRGGSRPASQKISFGSRGIAPGAEGVLREGAEPSLRSTASPKIAVSRDAALFFLYEANLDCLREAGAELAFFSPLMDAALPEGCCGVYLCGGYPELYGRELSANRGMLESLHGFAGMGGPVFAECGGYMYLMSELKDAEGGVWPMVGHFPWACRMESGRRELGYRAAQTLAPSCLGPAGTRLRGHVFHYSTALEPEMDLDPCATGKTGELSGGPTRLFSAENAAGVAQAPLGALSGSVAASYLHVHFASNPDLARNFVGACAVFGAEHGLI